METPMTLFSLCNSYDINVQEDPKGKRSDLGQDPVLHQIPNKPAAYTETYVC